MIVNRRREPQLKSGLFERVIDDTNFIEKIVFILWFGTGGMFRNDNRKTKVLGFFSMYQPPSYSK